MRRAALCRELTAARGVRVAAYLHVVWSSCVELREGLGSRVGRRGATLVLPPEGLTLPHSATRII